MTARTVAHRLADRQYVFKQREAAWKQRGKSASQPAIMQARVACKQTWSGMKECWRGRDRQHVCTEAAHASMQGSCACASIQVCAPATDHAVLVGKAGSTRAGHGQAAVCHHRPQTVFPLTVFHTSPHLSPQQGAQPPVRPASEWVMKAMNGACSSRGRSVPSQCARPLPPSLSLTCTPSPSSPGPPSSS